MLQFCTVCCHPCAPFRLRQRPSWRAHANGWFTDRVCLVVTLIITQQDTNAAVKFGPQGDVSLYRVSADTLRTDGNLVVFGVFVSRILPVESCALISCRQHYGRALAHQPASNYLTTERAHYPTKHANRRTALSAGHPDRASVDAIWTSDISSWASGHTPDSSVKPARNQAFR